MAAAFDGTNRIMTSTDGVTWTARQQAESNQWKGVAFGNNTFVVVSIDGTNRVQTATWIYN
ncbi:MAG: hypothetical protein RIF32_00475 [Leptospirales bacterium]|jgi:hypothetical protein